MIEIVRVWLVNFAIDAARYLIAAGGAFALFWIWGRERFRHRLVQGRFPRREKLLHDLRWSASTVVIFSVIGTGLWFGRHVGIFRSYEHVDDLGWPWFVASMGVLVVLHDTYFYFTHRAMHHPRLYRLFHRVHHVSTLPSPFTSYAFAVPEALVEAFFVPMVWLVLPLHEIAVFSFLVFMIVKNVIGHLSIELFPAGFTRSRFLGIHTTTTHHALHHKHFDSNYGLYFTFWDRVMGTEHSRYHELFDEVASAQHCPSPAGERASS